MSSTGYLILAIAIIIILLITFVTSFVLYRRTPVPKGCENIKINEDNCSKCSHSSECHIYQSEKGDK